MLCLECSKERKGALLQRVYLGPSARGGPKTPLPNQYYKWHLEHGWPLKILHWGPGVVGYSSEGGCNKSGPVLGMRSLWWVKLPPSSPRLYFAF